MSSQLHVVELAARLTSFPHDRYLYIGGFMRSVAWAAGTLVLLQILRNPGKYLPRLLPWAVSFLATMVTLMTWGRGILLTNSRANVWDSVLPILMGIVEFCLFALLAPPETFGGERTPTNSPDFIKHPALRRFFQSLHAWHFWFFVLATHTALAVLLVSNRIITTDIPHDYEPSLQSLAREYMGWMQADKAGAKMGTWLFAGFGVVMVLTIYFLKLAKTSGSRKRYFAIIPLGMLYLILFAVPILIFWGVINDAEKQRQRTDDEVSRLVVNPNPQPAAAPCPATSP